MQNPGHLFLFLSVFFSDLYRTGFTQHYNHDAAEIRLVAFKENNKWGYKDLSDNIVIKPEFDSATNFKEGVALIRHQSKYFLINPAGEILKEIKGIKTPDVIATDDARRKENRRSIENLPSYRVQSPTNCFPNFDFEDGDFRNWETNTGRTDDVNMVKTINMLTFI